MAEQFELQIIVKIEEDGTGVTSKIQGGNTDFVKLIEVCTAAASNALANLYTAHLVMAGYEDSEALREVFFNNHMPLLRSAFKRDVDLQLARKNNMVIVRGEK